MSLPIPSALEPALLDSAVEGRHLRPGTLRDQLGARPTLLIFLRHLGCPFAREWLDEVAGEPGSDPSFPAPLYVHLGTVEQGETYFSSFAPGARAIADPGRRLYRAFQVPRAPAFQLLDPRVWACGFRATKKGMKAGKPVGDPFQMPALFLVEGDRVVWRSIPAHMGELPNVAGVPRPVVV